MKLPVLTTPREDSVVSVSYCGGLDGCKECQMYKDNGGRCDGCTSSHQEKLADDYLACYKQCHTCTGFRAEVSAVCCRSPLKEIYMGAAAKGDDWNKVEWDLKKRPKLKFDTKAIFYVSAGSIGTLIEDPGGYLVPDDTEVVAISLSRVMGAHSFASKDIRDYLRIPPKTKMILLTMSKDDVLERAWEKCLYDKPELLQEVGFDYWMPLAFSSYRSDSRMQQYHAFLKTMYASEKSEAWFFNGNFLRPGLDLADQFDVGVQATPQIIFNAQFITKDEILRHTLRETTWFNERYPKKVAFWYVGSVLPRFIHNVRKICGNKRPLYFVSANPQHYAAQGREMKISGNGVPTTIDRPELLRMNQKTFEKVVNDYGYGGQL